MLEKNKDYIEMRVSSTDCAFTQDGPIQISVDGHVYTPYMDLPTPGEFYILISKEKFEKLQTENEEPKKKLHEPDPFAEYKELLEKLYSKDDAEKFEWTLNHVCGGQGSVNGWMVSSKLWRRNYEALSKLVGFSSVEEIQDYLTNEAKCDTLHEAIHLMCKEMDRRRKKIDELEREIGIYSRALNEWKEGTGCPSPSAAKTLIESAISWHDAYNEVVEKKRKLTDEVESWKHVTGYSTPEGFLAAKINDLGNDYISWKMVTGCSCPKDLSKKIVEWEEILTPHMSARDLCSAMSNVIDFDKRKEREIESAREALRKLNLAIQKELESNIDEWQKATGCSTPEEAETTMRYLRGKIDEMKEFASIASNWTDRIVED